MMVDGINGKLASAIVKIFTKLPKKMRGNGTFDKLVNESILKWNEARGHKTRNLLNDGEKHAIFIAKDKSLQPAQFCGPNSKVLQRIGKLFKENGNDLNQVIRDKNFEDLADKECLAHDIRFGLNNGRKDKESKARIREADNRFIRVMKQLRARNLSSIWNVVPSQLGIEAKVALENNHILDRGSFATGSVIGTKEQPIYEALEKMLRKQGYGKARPPNMNYRHGKNDIKTFINTDSYESTMKTLDEIENEFVTDVNQNNVSYEFANNMIQFAVPWMLSDLKFNPTPDQERNLTHRIDRLMSNFRGKALHSDVSTQDGMGLTIMKKPDTDMTKKIGEEDGAIETRDNWKRFANVVSQEVLLSPSITPTRKFKPEEEEKKDDDDELADEMGKMGLGRNPVFTFKQSRNNSEEKKDNLDEKINKLESNKGVSKWVEFVRKIAKEQNITYGKAMSVASPLWKQMKNK